MEFRRGNLAFVALLLLLSLATTTRVSAANDDNAKKKKGDTDHGSIDENNFQQGCTEGEGDKTCKARIVTVEELSTKTGEDGGTELWLSIFGKVYNVSKGPEYYAPKSGYHIFAGRDGTIPFITGNFTDEECAKHTDELTAAQLYALDREWSNFYAKEERYPFVGFLCCRFYNDQGQPTEETQRVWQRVKSYEKIKAAKDRERKEARDKRKKRLMNTMATTT
ncbi:Neuferricin homolog [Seminavis robusta]|uniref:Neuferricin homolog n=1 Tax=Seminavis robusta TaxID=568900 RepID=A0A9N8EBT7_9STRA|nr:Neuferricin homolog [Seminavis robusta]|eukprot:Sro730_g194070.1 Neuferricin homolog (222) ;mRNA; r:32602-33267